VKKALVYSPDGRLLVCTGEDGTQIDIWDTQTSRRFTSLTGHEGAVFSVAFSGDGRLLASASGDHTVRVWDLAAAKCVSVLTGHTDQVFSAVFHPDGKRLASAGRDRAIWLWDLATGREVARLEGHTNYVFSLAFSPDGRSLASGSGDGTVRLWDTEQPARRHQARREAESLRPEAERLVARLFAEQHQPTDVVARLSSDASLSAPLRHAAMREVMRRGQHLIPQVNGVAGPHTTPREVGNAH
jgi:WD40 repeat protein